MFCLDIRVYFIAMTRGPVELLLEFRDGKVAGAVHVEVPERYLVASLSSGQGKGQ